MTVILAILSAGVWLTIALTGNDLREPPTRQFWTLLIAAFVLNVLALFLQ